MASDWDDDDGWGDDEDVGADAPVVGSIAPASEIISKVKSTLESGEFVDGHFMLFKRRYIYTFLANDVNYAENLMWNR